MPSVAIKSENTGLLHGKVVTTDNFGCFSDITFFGPVFGRAFKNRTLSEKSDGLAALALTTAELTGSMCVCVRVGKRNEKEKKSLVIKVKFKNSSTRLNG